MCKARIMSKQKFKSCIVYNLHAIGETIKIKAEAGNFNTVGHGNMVGVKHREHVHTFTFIYTWQVGNGNSGELIIYPDFLEVLPHCLYLMQDLPKELPKFSSGNPRDTHRKLGPATDS